MRRVIFTLLILALPLFHATAVPAQEAPQAPGDVQELVQPLDPQTQETPEPEPQGVALLDVIAQVADRLDVTFIFSERLLQNEYVDSYPVVTELPANDAQVWDVLRMFMSQCGYGWMRAPAEGHYTIGRIDDMMQTVQSAVSDPADLPVDTFIGTLIVYPEFAEVNSLQRGLMGLLSRPGGSMQVIQNGIMQTPSRGRSSSQQRSHALLISDYPHVLREIYTIVQRVDQAPEVVPAAPATDVISLLDVIQQAADRLGVTFVYNEPELVNEHVDIYPLAETMPTEPTAIWNFLRMLLMQRGFGWTRMPAERHYAIARIDVVARTMGPVVNTPDEIPDDVCIATMAVHLQHAEVNSVQRALMNLMSRPGGVIQPIQGLAERLPNGQFGGGGGLLISDTPNVLRGMYEFLMQIDSFSTPATPMTPEPTATPEPDQLMAIALQHISPRQALEVLGEIFSQERREGVMRFAYMPNVNTPHEADDNRIFIRCPQSLGNRIRQAVALIDVDPTPPAEESGETAPAEQHSYIVALRHVLATDVVHVIQDLFVDDIVAGNLTVGSDRHSATGRAGNHVVFTCTPDLAARVQTAIAELDVEE